MHVLKVDKATRLQGQLVKTILQVANTGIGSTAPSVHAKGLTKLFPCHLNGSKGILSNLTKSRNPENGTRILSADRLCYT